MPKLVMPEYEAKRSKDFSDYLIVWCQHEDCGKRPFLVVAKEWLRPRRIRDGRTGQEIIIIGRVCPYCHRVGTVTRRVNIR